MGQRSPYSKVAPSVSVFPGSSAHVTVTNFQLGTDSLFFKGETAALKHDVVFTAKEVDGGAKVILPDGTTMTLLGVTVKELDHQFIHGGHLFMWA